MLPLVGRSCRLCPALLCSAAAWSAVATLAAASCGDYVRLGDRSLGARGSSSDLVHDGTPQRPWRLPCTGPECSGTLPAPAAPIAPVRPLAPAKQALHLDKALPTAGAGGAAVTAADKASPPPPVLAGVFRPPWAV